MNIHSELTNMHEYLMYKKSPYHSVSAIHRSQDLGFHVIFMEDVRSLVTEEIQNQLKLNGVTFSFVTKS